MNSSNKKQFCKAADLKIDVIKLLLEQKKSWLGDSSYVLFRLKKAS